MLQVFFCEPGRALYLRRVAKVAEERIKLLAFGANGSGLEGSALKLPLVHVFHGHDCWNAHIHTHTHT